MTEGCVFFFSDIAWTQVTEHYPHGCEHCLLSVSIESFIVFQRNGPRSEKKPPETILHVRLCGLAD